MNRDPQESYSLFKKYKTEKIIYSRNRDFKEWTLRYKPTFNNDKNRDLMRWQDASIASIYTDSGESVNTN